MGNGTAVLQLLQEHKHTMVVWFDEAGDVKPSLIYSYLMGINVEGLVTFGVMDDFTGSSCCFAEHGFYSVNNGSHARGRPGRPKELEGGGVCLKEAMELLPHVFEYQWTQFESQSSSCRPLQAQRKAPKGGPVAKTAVL